MKTLGVIWAVIVNIITVVVVFAIFSATSTKFETVALVVLVLIYLNVWRFMATWGLSEMQLAIILDRELKVIKNALGVRKEQQNQEQVWQAISEGKVVEMSEEGEEEMRKEAIEKTKNATTKYYINAGFQTVIYIIALYQLFMALNS